MRRNFVLALVTAAAAAGQALADDLMVEEAPFVSTMSRAEVTAAYIAERGEVAALTGEDSGSMQLAQGDLPAPVAQIAAAE